MQAAAYTQGRLGCGKQAMSDRCARRDAVRVWGVEGSWAVVVVVVWSRDVVVDGRILVFPASCVSPPERDGALVESEVQGLLCGGAAKAQVVHTKFPREILWYMDTSAVQKIAGEGVGLMNVDDMDKVA